MPKKVNKLNFKTGNLRLFNDTAFLVIIGKGFFLS